MDRRRTVEAALHYLGETPFAKTEPSAGSEPEQQTDSVAGYPPTVGGWLKQNNVTTDELDQVFHFGGDNVRHP